MELIKPDININFVGRRGLAYVFSGLLILASLVSLVLHGGPNFGIDFAGGVLVQVRFDKPTNAAEVKKALEPVGLGDALVQRFGGKDVSEFLIRTQHTDKDLTNLSDSIRESLVKAYGADGCEIRRVEMVGPKVGADLREKALLAIFYSLLLIAVYISGRFEAKWVLAAVMAAVLVGATLLVETLMVGWLGGPGSSTVFLIVTALVVTVGACWVLKLRYALGAIVALIHDVIITVGVFSLLNKEFTLATVAAVLTIIGYSLNDTIIVFDRIRENLKTGRKKDLGLVINESVNQTLSRTILTSGTTLLVLACLFILGGGVIEDFALALLVGVGVGTYSSIFVASPILLAMPEGAPGFKLGSRKPAAPAVSKSTSLNDTGPKARTADKTPVPRTAGVKAARTSRKKRKR